MPSFIKKHGFWFVSAGILILYLATRLYNILSLPIFTDEAIYVRWAQYFVSDLKFWDYSMSDGKQPSFIWIATFLMRIFQDPLFAGRFVSVLAGLGSMVGLYFLTSELFSSNPKERLLGRKMGLTASCVYVLYPFALVYDRLAIYDSLVAMFMIWSLYFEVLLVRRRKLLHAVVLGLIMGGGMLTKTSANFAFYLLPFSLLLFEFREKKWRSKLINWAIYALLAAFIANGIYLMLRFSPYFHIIDQKNITFVYSLSEWVRHPFTFFPGNLRGLGGWLLGYMTAPFLVLAVSSFLVGKQFLREKLLLFIWFLAPFTALALFGKVIYPRFILFMSMPLLVLGSYTLFYMISSARRLWLQVVIAIVFLSSFAVNDYFILTNFAKANIPPSDREQFVTGWPAGGGVRESIEYLTEVSKNQKIFVGTEGTFGLMPYALEIYLKDNKNIEIKGYWPVDSMPSNEVLAKAATMPTYFVFYQPCPSCPKTGVAPIQWPAEKILQIEKPEQDSFYTLYKITPQ
jgi:4-amino-4-deoxy-L-arabinose transferase-like glycosyltransferase